jgi:hypothetical protein
LQPGAAASYFNEESGRIPGSAGDRAIRSNKNAYVFLFRFYPLRVPKSAFHGGFWHRSLPAANSIYLPLADSNGNSGIHAAAPAAKFLTAKSKR